MSSGKLNMFNKAWEKHRRLTGAGRIRGVAVGAVVPTLARAHAGGGGRGPAERRTRGAEAFTLLGLEGPGCACWQEEETEWKKRGNSRQQHNELQAKHKVRLFNLTTMSQRTLDYWSLQTDQVILPFQTARQKYHWLLFLKIRGSFTIEASDIRISHVM